MKEFKIRASAAGNIMGVRGLGKIGETYCKNWLKGQILDYEKIISSKYIDKGNLMENESIDFIAEQLKYGFLLKNEDHFENEYMTGTPDIITTNEIIDAKNSWDASTFPLFDKDIPNKDYYWQLQCYMKLTGKKKAKLVYCLMDTPENLIEKEARWYSLSQGFEELDMKIYEKFVRNLTYKSVDNKLKIKYFDIDRNDDDIDKLISRVRECRIFIDELLKQIK